MHTNETVGQVRSRLGEGLRTSCGMEALLTGKRIIRHDGLRACVVGLVVEVFELRVEDSKLFACSTDIVRETTQTTFDEPGH